ncbi:hypothetical protein [Phenylobacterium sp. J367]|uniref:hypothetical protein n=1 Tax=Phenylobacterium sp. J367 TaxID=2898435 RepID=UPI002150E8CE|nr:hypothetical protein [Phenylobacterium sp. J367]MCR5877272.1 hypothetical protein [Phenylobacterium sp. J367]
MTAEVKKATFALDYEGKALDFSHLEPMDLACPTQARPNGVRINVRFSCHCFTEAYDAAKHDGRPMMMDRGKQRAFCPARFELSQQLPDLIRSLPDAHVYMTPEANFVRLALNEDVEYRMYFNVRRFAESGYDLQIFVESAYRPDTPGLPPEKMQKVRFKVLVDKVLTNQKLKFHRR